MQLASVPKLLTCSALSTLVFTRRACLEGRRDKSTSIELCASMVAKLECHLINTQGPVTDPLTEEL